MDQSAVVLTTWLAAAVPMRVHAKHCNAAASQLRVHCRPRQQQQWQLQNRLAGRYARIIQKLPLGIVHKLLHWARWQSSRGTSRLLAVPRAYFDAEQGRRVDRDGELQTPGVIKTVSAPDL